MDSEEPPNVRVACSGDIDEVVRLMHDAAAWMSAKGTPAWDVARIDRTFAETFVLRSELLVASCSDGIVGCCTLSAEDPEFWPDCRFQKTAALNVRSRLHYSSGGVGSIRQRRAAAGHQRTQGGLSATGRSMRHRWPSRRGSESARIDLRCPTSH